MIASMPFWQAFHPHSDLKSQNLSTFLFCFSPRFPKRYTEVEQPAVRAALPGGLCPPVAHRGASCGVCGQDYDRRGPCPHYSTPESGPQGILHGLLTTAPTMCPFTPPARDCRTLTHSLTLTHRVTQTHSEADCPLWGGGIASLRPQPQLPLPPWGPSPAWR